MQGFKYENSTGQDYDDIKLQITSVTFDISRYGKYTKELTFAKPVTIKKAIEKVEKKLSKPFTKKYYERIQDDLLCSEEDYEDAKHSFNSRGDLLTDYVFLEKIHVENGAMTFSIGS